VFLDGKSEWNEAGLERPLSFGASGPAHHRREAWAYQISDEINQRGRNIGIDAVIVDNQNAVRKISQHISKRVPVPAERLVELQRLCELLDHSGFVCVRRKPDLMDRSELRKCEPLGTGGLSIPGVDTGAFSGEGAIERGPTHYSTTILNDL
jgi:hypothetical protein